MKRVLTFITAIIIFSGCVRFIDSRKNLIKDEIDPAATHVGIDAFYRHDREQRARLEQLIDQRLNQGDSLKNLEYRVGSGDTLSLHVMNFEEISKEYKVSLDGTITLPFVGKIDASKKTETQLADLISKKLNGFIVDPAVTISITDFSAHKVWVMRGNQGGLNAQGGGQGNNQGSYPLKRPQYPLIELLLEIGNFSINQGGVIYLYPQAANTQKKFKANETITVNPFCTTSVRGMEAKVLGGDEAINCNQASIESPSNLNYDENARIQIDLEELFGGATHSPLYVPLLPGDIVMIPEDSTIQVFGEVFQRGGFRIANGANGNQALKPTLFSLISAARGFTYSADIHEVEIYRELEFGKKVVLSVDFEELVLKKTQDIRLRDGDIVLVPSHKTRFYEDHSIRAINALLGSANGVNQISRNGN